MLGWLDTVTKGDDDKLRSKYEGRVIREPGKRGRKIILSGDLDLILAALEAADIPPEEIYYRRSGGGSRAAA